MGLCSFTKDFLLPIVGILLILFQINQQTLTTRKEITRAVYASFLSETLRILAATRNTLQEPEDINQINRELAKLTLNASPAILDPILDHVKGGGKIDVNYINGLRIKMRNDLNPQWWEYIPIINQLVYSCLETAIDREHMLWMTAPEKKQ